MNRADLDFVAEYLQADPSEAIEPECLFSQVFYGIYEGKVVSKERPRTGRNGHVYTPTKTREFENQVRRWLDHHYTLDLPVYFPVSVILEIFDPFPKSINVKQRWLAQRSILFKGMGDLDNKAKAILDAANKLIYADDKQIVNLAISRRHATCEGFSLEVRRAGLSPMEADQLAKLIKVR